MFRRDRNLYQQGVIEMILKYPASTTRRPEVLFMNFPNNTFVCSEENKLCQ